MSTINFSMPKKFGAKDDNSAAVAAERPKADLWINIGYTSDVQDDDGNPMFVSLPQGIPLDTQEHLKTNSSNNKFAGFQAARNDLLDQLIEHANKLQPGESTVVSIEVQVRRVREEQAPIDPVNNPFGKKLDL